MRTYLLVFTLIFPIILWAQQRPNRPFEPIKFKEFQPEWYVVNYDSQMDNSLFDGYNNFIKVQGFEPLIINNGIYELYYQQNTLEPTGTYVQKRSLEDGTLLWRQYIGYPNDPQQILGRALQVNLDNQLEVIFQVKCDPYDPFYPLLGRNNMSLYKIIFNSSDGQLIDEINYSCSDTSLIKTNFDLFYMNSVSRFYTTNNKFQFTQSKWDGSNWLREIFQIEDDFVQNTLYSRSFPKKYACYGDLPIFFNDSTKIVFNSNCMSKRMEMTFIDDEFNIIKTVISDSLSSKLNELQVKEFDPIRRRLLLENVINFDTKEIELLIIDVDGKLLKRITMPAKYNRNYGIIHWDDINEVTFLSSLTRYSADAQPYVSFDLLKSDGEGQVKLMYSFVPTDSLRYITFSKLIGVDNDHFYFEFNESSLKKEGGNYSLDFNASAFSMMKIKKKSLFEPTSTTDKIVDNSMRCFPNPTSGIVTIKGLDVPVSIFIFDVHGKMVKNIEHISENINIDELPNGVYYLEINTNRKREKHRIVKVY